MMKRFLEGENKYRFILSLLLSLFVVIVAGAIILSNVEFKEEVEGTIATVLNEGDLIINYVDGQEVYFNDSKAHTYGITVSPPLILYKLISFSSVIFSFIDFNTFPFLSLIWTLILSILADSK